MSNAGLRPEARAALFVLAVTAWRIATLAFDRTELWVDEAQYWLWSRNLDWGYFSKPPLIAFWLRAVTDLAGSDGQFWIRVSGSVLHAVTAGLIGLSAARLYGGRVGPWAAALYVTTPFVAVGSWQFSTDTVMLPCFALGLYAWTHLRTGRSIVWALTLGLAAGLGMLGKYAAAYLPILLALAALTVPSARIAARDAGVAAAAALAVVSPNVIWNLANGGTTFRHVAEDNAKLSETAFDPGAALDFLASQIAVFGPFLLGALFFGLFTLRRRGPESRALLALSLPVVLLMTLQAARAGANANWAVTAYVAGTALAAAMLGPRLMRLSVALGLVVTIALPLAYMNADWLRTPDGRLLARRYMGTEALSTAIAEAAKAQDLRVVVASRRSVIADLFHTYRQSDLEFYAPPPQGKPGNYYEQAFPLPDAVEGQVLYAATGSPPCAAAVEVGSHAPADGLYAGESYRFWRLPAACLRP
jgi:4-amino-4-deoxy-L-arabinose transferase-like glycosyltransferase